jgi:hypothetical protein
MSRMQSIVVGIAVAAWALAAGAGAARASTIVLPRPGQVGIAVQGQYGTLLDQGNLGKEFGTGPGMAVRARYRMRYERALGVSFESETFDARTSQPADSLYARKQFTTILSGVEIYQMFGTRTRSTKYVCAGISLAQTSYKLNDGETEYPGDGMALTAGAGVERFFYRSWAFDLGARYLALFQDGKVNHDLQASVGLVFYASY